MTLQYCGGPLCLYRCASALTWADCTVRALHYRARRHTRVQVAGMNTHACARCADARRGAHPHTRRNLHCINDGSYLKRERCWDYSNDAINLQFFVSSTLWQPLSPLHHPSAPSPYSWPLQRAWQQGRICWIQVLPGGGGGFPVTSCHIVTQSSYPDRCVWDVLVHITDKWSPNLLPGKWSLDDVIDLCSQRASAAAASAAVEPTDFYITFS